jgi:signal transduction histidine kinase
MVEFFTSLFSSNGFMPHGHCYLWKPGLVWLQVVSNGLIGLSYVSISLTLVYLVYRIRNIPFQWIYLAFGLFIISCGFTHFMDVWTVWDPIYWTDGALRAITALASVGTAALLPSLVPKAVGLTQSAKVALDRGVKLETANQELSSLFEKTKELDQLKTQFFANVSHELRTPLALILGPIEKLSSAANLTEEQSKNIEVVGRNARTLLKHVNDLLDIAKLEAGKMAPHYVETDLSKLVRLSSSNFDGIAKDQSISFGVNTPQVLWAQIDPDMIHRILINLLSNAFKFTPRNGTITVTLHENLGQAILSVQDSGPGIPLQMKEAIFERFRQIEGGSVRQFGGTGLGLSIAKEFTELHRGNIQVTEAPRGGALFSVVLPLAAPQGALVGPAVSPSKVSETLARQALESLEKVTRHLDPVAAGDSLEKGKVLVVEDNPDMNRFIVETLSRHYQVITAYDGKEGLEKAISTHPDLILSDIMMPVMSGDQLVAEIRKIPELKGLPIMLLTAKADDDLRIRLLREGAQDYVTKPFSAEEVLVRVKNLVTIKRAREALQTELSSQLKDLEALTHEVTTRRIELQQSAERLQVARKEAERASQAKSTFLGLVSHEMKTPITSLQLQLQILKRADEGKFTSRQREMIERLWKSSQRSVELINSILEFIRVQNSRIEPEPELLDLPALVVNLVDSFQEAALEKKLTLKMLPPPQDLPQLQSDSFLVPIVISNLIANAIKYTDQGSIQVYIVYENGQHRVAVQDTGPGIPPDQQARIFEPFEQLEPLDKKHKSGFGLGLAIARETVRAVNGKIELTSEVGKGSTFSAIFPSINDPEKQKSA